MDNETIKQAEKIANRCKETRYEEHHDWGDGELELLEVTDYRNCYNSAIKMAEWKDKQFKKIVKDYIELAYDSGQQANLLEDLLKEL